MAKMQDFTAGERFTDASYAAKLHAIIARLNKLERLTGDGKFISVTEGPAGRVAALNIEILRQHIGKGVILIGKGQQYSGEATGVAWKKTATAGIALVRVKRCDEDGSNPISDTISIYCYHSTGADPNIRVDMVVPYVLAFSARLVVLGDFTDGKIGDVKMWAEHSAGTPRNIPAGWVLATGAGGSSIDMGDAIIGAYKSGGSYFDTVGANNSPATLQMINTHDSILPHRTIALIERIN